MTALASPSPLLLDNERLRDIMREREQWPAGSSSHQPAIIRQLVKPGLVANLANLTEVPTPAAAFWPQQQWPDLLRQLHWELCSSTQLRPVARIMDRTALLPDPFVALGGLHSGTSPLSADIPAQHPATKLFTALRLDVVLAGEWHVVHDGNAITLHAGDAHLGDAMFAAGSWHYGSDSKVWTAFYYSPDPCCCRSRSTQDATT